MHEHSGQDNEDASSRQAPAIQATKKPSHTSDLAATLFEVRKDDRVDEAEGDGVVHALGRGIQRLGGFALVEVVDQPAGEAAAGPGEDAAGEWAASVEVVIAWEVAPAGSAFCSGTGRSRRGREGPAR